MRNLFSPLFSKFRNWGESQLRKIKKSFRKFTRVSAASGITYLVDRFVIGVTLILVGMAIFIGIKFYHEPITEGATESVTLKTYGLTRWDWLAIGISIISLVYAALTFWSQRQTQRNTMKITPESQRKLLIEYGRHFYCNLIVICAIDAKMNNRFSSYYPSEEHLVKLKADLNGLHTGAFFNHIEHFSSLNKLQVKLRNFNSEIDVILNHLTQQEFPEEGKVRDFNTLKFKMGYLTDTVFRTLNEIWTDNEKKHSADMRKYINKEAESRNMRTDEGKTLMAQAEKYFESHPLIFTCDYENSELIAALFYRPENNGKEKEPYSSATVTEIDNFIKLLNYNIYAEIHGLNSFGSPKIYLVPFPNQNLK